MSSFKLQFKTDDDFYRTSSGGLRHEAIMDTLREAVDRVDNAQYTGHKTQWIVDRYGNRVGEWSIVESSRRTTKRNPPKRRKSARRTTRRPARSRR